MVLYPLQAPNRRLERRREILEQVAERCGYHIGRVVDLSPFEAQGRYPRGHRIAGAGPYRARGLRLPFAANG